MRDSTTTTIAPPAIQAPAATPAVLPQHADEPLPANPPAEASESARDSPARDSDTAPQAASLSTLWMTDRDIAVFTGLAAIVVVLLVVRWLQLTGWGSDEIEIERLTPIVHNGQLDLNRAGWVELSQLDGVGEAIASRIVEDRRINGTFHSIDDLDRVKGIGPRTVDRLRPYLKVEADVAPDDRAGVQR